MAGDEQLRGVAVAVLAPASGQHVLLLGLEHREAPDLREVGGKARSRRRHRQGCGACAHGSSSAPIQLGVTCHVRPNPIMRGVPNGLFSQPSSARTVWLRVAVESPSRFAALVKLASSATATKALNSANCVPRMGAAPWATAGYQNLLLLRSAHTGPGRAPIDVPCLSRRVFLAAFTATSRSRDRLYCHPAPNYFCSIFFFQNGARKLRRPDRSDFLNTLLQIAPII
jgi:hypothetical protein